MPSKTDIEKRLRKLERHFKAERAKCEKVQQKTAEQHLDVNEELFHLLQDIKGSIELFLYY